MDFLVHHMLRSSARRFPDREALVHGSHRLSYAEVLRRSRGVAHGLRSEGVSGSDRIGILLEPSVSQALSIFGVSEAGGAFVPIHHSLFPDQVAHIVRDCGMKGLITDGSRLRGMTEALKRSSSLEFVALSEGETPGDCPLATHDLEKWCEETPQSPLRDVAIEKDLAAILYTSGSTGRPKGVMLSHANLVAGASIVSSYLEIRDSERILAALPFSFDAGLNQLTTTIQQGGTLVLIKFVFAREILETLRKERITGLAGVPSLWSLLVHSTSGLDTQQLPHLRYVTNTGGAMPRNVLSKLRAALPDTQVFLMYGLTEAFRSTYLPPEEVDRRPDSIGKAIPNSEILVVDDTGELCAPGEAGELVHHGPTVSLGYWGDPELTSRVLKPHPFPPPGLPVDHKVCYSGDLVRADEEGFLYFVGRRDNMIKSSGFRVSPLEVEEVLCRSGMVREAAAIGIPDEFLGQRIKAFVVPIEGTSVDLGDLLAYCASSMPRHMVPKSLAILDALPKTSSGKVDYGTLRRREENSLHESEEQFPGEGEAAK